jgi:predicted enzyme related to lactoylglutathione lyase
MTSYNTTRAGFILAASDVFGLAKFYEQALGFELAETFEDPPYVILVKSGMRLSLTQDGNRGDDLPGFTFRVNPDRAERAACMVLEVDDCDAAREDLAAHGVAFRSETFRPPWGGARFFCEDPEGNLIEIEQLA